MNHPPLPLPFAQALLDFEVQVTDKEPLKGASLLSSLSSRASSPGQCQTACAGREGLQGKGKTPSERASERASGNKRKHQIETKGNERESSGIT